MNRRIRYAGVRSGNPVVSALMAVVGAVVIGAALVFGFFAFLFLASVVLVLAGVVGLRLWWAGRKLRKSFEAEARRNREEDNSPGSAIEGEYHVVSTHRKGERSGEKSRR
ncbi:MAG: hypothetical protein WD448_04590 [Woeseia sp.]